MTGKDETLANEVNSLNSKFSSLKAVDGKFSKAMVIDFHEIIILNLIDIFST